MPTAAATPNPVQRPGPDSLTSQIGLGTAIRIAAAGFLGPVAATRAFRRLLLLSGAFLALLIVPSLLGFISRDELRTLRELAIVPGIPVAAALLAEMALRDGLTQRTLLYALLGPVSRPILAATRTVLTSMLLGAGGALLLGVFHLLLQSGWGAWPRDVLAVCCGSIAYVSAFGLIHLLTRRGLIAAIALYAVFDHAIGMLPFSIRLLAPSYHLRVLGDATQSFPIPVPVSAAESTPFLATIVLLAIGAVTVVATGQIFARKNVAELC